MTPEHYAAMLTGAGHRTLARIRGTQLGESAGMIGAAEVARTALHADLGARGGVGGDTAMARAALGD